ncbi:WYL domain-containing protein [Parabacteroides sp. OttesenSCG-928-B22]|nr:WYL domain-containing protein [Parabacteroides sp. OttesenSCG-928-B22]
MGKKKSSKDTTSNLFNRYVWLVDMIYRKGKITFEEINAYWLRSQLNLDGEDLPLRTFHNHRKAIEQMFDINIECDKRDGYTYYIENADDMKRGGVRSWLLNTFAVNNLINESHKLKNRILFEHIPSGREYLTPLIEAMRDNLLVEISYQSYWRDTPSLFEIEPFCVKVFKQRWYVIARNPEKQELRIYALDRILQLRQTDQPFQYPSDFDPQEYFDGSFGIIVDEEYDIEQIRIKAYGNKSKYLRALPLHHTQKEVETKGEYVVFEYLLRPTYDLQQELLSHKNDIEVLSPLWLREEMIADMKKMLEVYGM